MCKYISNDNEKYKLYKNEIPYRIVSNIVKMYWPYQYEKELYKYGLLVIKPEAVVTGNISKIFSILQDSRYKLVYIIRKNIGPVCATEMWKFSWLNSSLERILINQKLFSLCDSLILILRPQNISNLSACEMLTDLKGSALESKRKPYQIRKKIKPINYILNYVHTSDDINDFLRELGILLDWNELLQAFEAMSLNHTIPYPNINEFSMTKQDDTLDSWLNNIYSKMMNSNIPSFEKEYIMKHIQILKDNTGQKITLDFLRVLCQCKLIEWNFATIVVLSNNINYLE